ncbi:MULTISPECIES: hypothetical protein [unclassified Coleofasciculus]|uniref:DUF6930 domain-containing protein n=1 Tax=Cyanophyceae TaxID=3028117 RepID=UPI001687095F|nr:MULTISPECIES: hypothetical protein [unclassified Coleofasciculus]MBD1881429.1 hypothetical protein [Coleofasciculus sp. FACHB-T130]MBD1941547.1 hypothetical protein [Coleofasciculus sp. FACHB-712]MBD2085450.1 hypothetical protein [Coleofasciculus sp. FACHB-542]
MSVLTRSTSRRLQTLQQIPSVWEGDRRRLSAGMAQSLESDTQTDSECIVWVDGVEGMVRAMDVVTSETGPEAVVRALLRAMEHPHSPAKPSRPQKIVVRHRELQFYLRGVLQDLDIAVDYVPELPLIDELFRGFQEITSTRPPKLPPEYAELLVQKAYEIWDDAPWELLADHQIISIELNQWDVETLYASVMGMLGMEYGILLYRSLDSLKRFRSSVLAKESFEELEEAFLGQDCLFVTFEQAEDSLDEDEEDEGIDLADLPLSEIQPNFGNVHPLEGMRPFLYEEEAIAVYVALEALHRFFRASNRQLAAEKFPTLSKRYRIAAPLEADLQKSIPVKVATVPDVATELFDMAEVAGLAEEEDSDLEEMMLPLRDDLVPKDSFLSLGMMTWDKVELLRKTVDCYQAKEAIAAGEGMPVVLIQTSRPKAKELIEQIQSAGGLKGICFNPGEDPFEGDRYDLGILQTENGNMYLFGEFQEDDPIHSEARRKWDQRCKKTKGYCGLIVARGLKGASRGNPQLGDMMALFEARSLSSKDLGLGMLQLMPQFEFE